MGNYKKTLFSLSFTHKLGLFYLDGILLSPLTWRKKNPAKKENKKLYIFKCFFTLKSSTYLAAIKQLSSQLPCNVFINPRPSSATYIETISSNGCAF